MLRRFVVFQQTPHPTRSLALIGASRFSREDVHWHILLIRLTPRKGSGNKSLSLHSIQTAQLDMQLAQLLLIHRRWCVGEQALGALGFGEGYYIAQAVCAG
jgi:hypothetical protein